MMAWYRTGHREAVWMATDNGYDFASGEALSLKSAQLAAEAAARELAMKKILEALALWPDAIDEYLAAKAKGEEGEV